MTSPLQALADSSFSLYETHRESCVSVRCLFDSLYERQDDIVVDSSGKIVSALGVASFGSNEFDANTVGLNCMTHGNEPAGLAAYYTAQYLQEYNLIKEGHRIIVSLANRQAAKLYFEHISAHPQRKHYIQRLCYRAVEPAFNMNRLPADKTLTEFKNSIHPDYAQTARLHDIVSCYDTALDIHSVSIEGSPTFFSAQQTPSNTLLHLLKGMNVKHMITHLNSFSNGNLLTYHFGNMRTNPERITLEAGFHEDASSFIQAMRSTLVFLAQQNALTQDAETFVAEHYIAPDNTTLNIIKVADVFRLPDDAQHITLPRNMAESDISTIADFTMNHSDLQWDVLCEHFPELESSLENFDYIKKGDPLLLNVNNGYITRAPRNGYAVNTSRNRIFCKARFNEALFFWAESEINSN